MTFTEAKQEIEEIIYSYLPEECGPQKTIFEAMNYSTDDGGDGDDAHLLPDSR